MLLETKKFSSLDFVKEQNESYFELLRLARVSEGENNHSVDAAVATKLLNELPLLQNKHKQNEHKRIIPLLYDKAQKLNIFDKLSPESQKLLTTITQQGIVTELARKTQLNQIITVLSAHNIPLMLLKGAAFADVLYSAQAPRTSNDLDILIQKKHWHKAVLAIKTIMNYTEKPQPDVFGDLYELSFVPKNKVGAALDLHVSLIHPLLFNTSEEQLWKKSVEHPSYTNKLVRILSPEHALIHQALHAYKDMNFCKYNLVDSHEIINAQLPDIEETIAIAKEWGASTPLYVLLKNCSEIMGSNVNSDSLKQVKPKSITHKIIKQLLKSHFTQPIENKKPLRYRVNQIIGQFVFTGSIIRPLALQWLFVKSLLTKPTL